MKRFSPHHRRIGVTMLVTLLLAPVILPAQSSAPPVSAPAAAPEPTPAADPAAAPAPATPPASSLAQLSPLASLPDWNELAAYAGTLSREEFESALTEVFLPDSPFPSPWVVGPDGVEIQTGQSQPASLKIPFLQRGQTATPPKRYWKTAAELPPLKDETQPLTDIHIAIDPGHIGGGYGVMEERRLSFAPGEAIQEGDLTLLTAQVLEQRLKALGAYVTLVRKTAAPVTERRPIDFLLTARNLLSANGFPNPTESYAGLQGDIRMLTVQWQSEKLFYRVAEIHSRADHLNQEIRPDLALCLHFNAEAWGDSADPQYSDKNHLHLMINGCYSLNEIATQDIRFEMMRRIFSKAYQEELALVQPLARSLAITTRLPPYVYTTPNARRVTADSYVYARNLLANRLYQCPVIYFEPYVMNHRETYQRLLRGHWIGRTLIGDQLQTSAIEDYVEGIVRGLTEYYRSQRPSA